VNIIRTITTRGGSCRCGSLVRTLLGRHLLWYVVQSREKLIARQYDLLKQENELMTKDQTVSVLREQVHYVASTVPLILVMVTMRTMIAAHVLCAPIQCPYAAFAASRWPCIEEQ
jgi:hypothetical protein